MFAADLTIVRAFGIKIVWTVHNKYNHENMHISLDILMSTILAKVCTAMKVACQSGKEEITGLFRLKDSSKIEVIPHGSYITAYSNNTDRENARNKLGIDENDFVFLHIGLIRRYKGVPELIEAFDRLSQRGTRLIIAGKPFTHQIQAEVSNKCQKNSNIVAVLDFIPDDEMQIYMNAADVVVLPYTDILTSGAVVLAMSFGKPVIAPAVGCIPEILSSDGQSELLYIPSEEDALLKKMRAAMNADLQEIGKDNFNRAANVLNWDWIAKETLALYQRCVGFTKG
jgi:glycosyltransferase involved in cell wall biosynthesis